MMFLWIINLGQAILRLPDKQFSCPQERTLNLDRRQRRAAPGGQTLPCQTLTYCCCCCSTPPFLRMYYEGLRPPIYFTTATGESVLQVNDIHVWYFALQVLQYCYTTQLKGSQKHWGWEVGGWSDLQGFSKALYLLPDMWYKYYKSWIYKKVPQTHCKHIFFKPLPICATSVQPTPQDSILGSAWITFQTWSGHKAAMVTVKLVTNIWQVREVWHHLLQHLTTGDKLTRGDKTPWRTEVEVYSAYTFPSL